jgi:hypothetical protein
VRKTTSNEPLKGGDVHNKQIGLQKAKKAKKTGWRMKCIVVVVISPKRPTKVPTTV